MLNWLKLDINILNDSKIKIIRKYPAGNDLFVLWIGLLCLAMKSSDSGYIYITSGIPYSIKDIANEFDIEEKTVEMGLKLFQQYKMIDFLQGGIIEIINFNKYQSLEKIIHNREMTKKRVEKYRQNKKQNLLFNNVTQCNENVTRYNENVTTTDKIRLDKIRLDKDKEENHYEILPKVQYLDVVFLFQAEYEKLITDYNKEIIDNKISDLNNYLLSIGKPKKYKSHYHTIIAWLKKDNLKSNNQSKKQLTDDDLPEHLKVTGVIKK